MRARSASGLALAGALACADPLCSAGGDGFLATEFQSFFAPSTTAGAALITSPHGTVFNALNHPSAITHPQSSRTACRSANPLEGGTPSGPAKPAPRVSANGLLRGLRCLLRSCDSGGAQRHGQLK